MKKLIGPVGVALALAAGACAQGEAQFGSGDVFANAGYNQILSGDLASAEQNLLQAIRTDPNNASAMLSLAALYETAGRNEQAAQLYQQVANMRPGQPPSVTYPAEMQGRSYPELAQLGLQRVRGQSALAPTAPGTTMPGMTPAR